MLKGNYTGLRAIERDDLELLRAWRNRPEYRKYFREFREISIEQQLSWYESVQRKNSDAKMFAIIDLENGELIGACGLCYLDQFNRSADLSIYIGTNGCYIDEKFAPDAAKTLITYGFDELNLHRIWSEIYSIDQKKQKLFKEIGLKHDGTLRQTHWTGGAWCDSLYFGIISGEQKT